MSYHIFFIIILLPAIIIGCAQKQSSTADITYPETKKVDTVDTYFGTKVPDPYRWLEDDNAEDTKAWVKTQNKITNSYLDDIPFRSDIKAKVEELIDYEKISAPQKHGDYHYYYKNSGLQDQSVFYRTNDLESDRAEVFLDPNTFSDDGTVSMAGTFFSDDGSLMTYLISDGGSDWRKAITLDTDTQKMIGDTLVNLKFTGISWKGNEGFYYISYERPEEGEQLTEANQQQKVYYHKLNTPQSSDEVVFGDSINRRIASAYLTEDNRYLVVSASSGTSGNELYIKDLQNPSSDFITIVDDMENDHSLIHSYGNRLLIYTNRNAPDYRVIETTIQNPTPDHWTDLIAEKEQTLTGASTARGYLFLNYLKDAKSTVKQLTLEGKFVRDIELPAIGSAGGFSAKKDDDELFYTFTSYTYPTSIFRYDIESGTSTLYEQPEVAFDPGQYTTKQVFYESKD